MKIQKKKGFFSNGHEPPIGVCAATRGPMHSLPPPSKKCPIYCKGGRGSPIRFFPINLFLETPRVSVLCQKIVFTLSLVLDCYLCVWGKKKKKTPQSGSLRKQLFHVPPPPKMLYTGLGFFQEVCVCVGGGKSIFRILGFWGDISTGILVRV